MTCGLSTHAHRRAQARKGDKTTSVTQPSGNGLYATQNGYGIVTAHQCINATIRYAHEPLTHAITRLDLTHALPRRRLPTSNAHVLLTVHRSYRTGPHGHTYQVLTRNFSYSSRGEFRTNLDHRPVGPSGPRTRAQVAWRVHPGGHFGRP